MKLISNPLWYTPVFLLFIIALIEGMHTMAHWHKDLDVHGYCKVYNMENPDAYDEDW